MSNGCNKKCNTSLIWHKIENERKIKIPIYCVLYSSYTQYIGIFGFGADDGNRTRVFGLGSGHSAIELHLRLLPYYYTPKLPVCQENPGNFFQNCPYFFVFTFYSISPVLAKPSIMDPSQTTTITYSQYENGQRQLPIGILIALARFYHTSTDYLLGLTDEQKPYP